jgi:hypothetical protein
VSQVLLVVLVAACQDSARAPTDPLLSPRPAASELSASSQSSDPLSSRLSRTPGSCLVAVRAADGHYLSRSVIVALPKNVASSSAGVARFAYRGWAPGVPEPVLLAVCSIPDAPAARAYFENRFDGKSMNSAQLQSFAQSAGVTGVENWLTAGPPQLMQGAGPAYVTDGLASESGATKAGPLGGVTGMMVVDSSGSCDPAAIIPAPGCPGYVDEQEYVPDQPPPPPDATPSYVDFQYGPPPLPLPSIIICNALTEYPHLSTTPGFYGNINVKARTTCPIPLAISVSTALGRQRCTFILCLWWPIGPTDSQSNPSGTFIEAKSNALCVWPVGWYMGISSHTVSGLGSTVTKPTRSPWIGIKCV